jgi:hypothetical protein
MSIHPDLPPAEQSPSSHRERVPGVLERLRLGRLATVCVGVEVAGAVISLLTGDPTAAEIGGFVDASVIGGALFGAHEYHVNGYPRDRQPMRSLIKDKSKL